MGRERVATPLPPAGRAEYERIVDGVRRAQGAAKFAAAWSAGRALSTDQAIDEMASLAAVLAVGQTVAPTPRPSYPAGLSDREAEVLRLVARGLTNAEAADRLYLSPRTVAAHLRRIYDKLGTSSRTEPIRFALQPGLA